MKKLSYNAAFQRLEEIVASFENETPELETLGERLKEAQALLKHCQATLLKVENDVSNLLNNNYEQK